MRVALLVSGELDFAGCLAAAWARAGDAVTLVLLDAAVAAVRQGHAHAAAVTDAVTAGVVVAAHDDALRRRGIAVASLPGGVKAVDLDEVADLVTDGADKALWL